MSQKAKCYWMVESPPCCIVYVTAKFLNLNDIEWIRVDLSQQEHLKPEFQAINPFHCVPTFIDDDGFKIWESRAIATYLIQKHKPDCQLYPAGDLKTRTLIDRWLQYDLGTLYRALSDVVYGIFRVGKADMEKLPRYFEVMDLVEKYLESQQFDYFAGTAEPTLADISTFFTLGLTKMLSEMDFSKYGRISAWYEKMEKFIKDLDQDQKLQEGFKMILQYAQFKMSQATQ